MIHCIHGHEKNPVECPTCGPSVLLTQRNALLRACKEALLAMDWLSGQQSMRDDGWKVHEQAVKDAIALCEPRS